MKRLFFYSLFLFCLFKAGAENLKCDTIPKNDLLVRVNNGVAFANIDGTGESSWYSYPDKESCGYQYGIDLLRYKKYIGYGIAFKHYMHSLSTTGENGNSMDENIRIFYLAPQFSYIYESRHNKEVMGNIDFGIGYAHYHSGGTIEGNHDFSAPASGLGANLNLGAEYRITAHWGFKISISAEYYYFKNMHDKEYASNAFEQRTKLNMLMIVPQIGIAYRF